MRDGGWGVDEDGGRGGLGGGLSMQLRAAARPLKCWCMSCFGGPPSSQSLLLSLSCSSMEIVDLLCMQATRSKQQMQLQNTKLLLLIQLQLQRGKRLRLLAAHPGAAKEHGAHARGGVVYC